MADARVFCTNRSLDADLVAATLQKHNIPFYLSSGPLIANRSRIITNGSIPIEVGAFPTTFVSIYVAAETAERARAIIEELPVREPEPGPPITARERRMFHVIVAIVALVLAAHVGWLLWPLAR